MGEGEGARDISSTLPYTTLPHGTSPQRDFAQSRRPRGRVRSLALLGGVDGSLGPHGLLPPEDVLPLAVPDALRHEEAHHALVPEGEVV